MCCAYGKPQTTTSPRRNFDAQAIDVLGHALEAQRVRHPHCRRCLYEPAVPMIYKICSAEEWQQALGRGCFEGSEVAERDGYLPFSAGEQFAITAAMRFCGRMSLSLSA